MRTMIPSIVVVGLLSSACSFMARGPEQYRDDTRALLETKSPDVRACYDSALTANPTMSGNVTVAFTVEKKTGVVTNVSVVPDRTTAPEVLSSCVVSALQGLTLTPEDKRDGLAVFTYEFTAQSA